MGKLNTLNSLLRKLGFELIKYTPRNNFALSRSKILKNLDIEIILDIGANVGKFGLELRESGFDGRIYSFEPLSGAFKKLEIASAKDNNWKIFNFAIGDRNGEFEINVSKNIHSSSFLEMQDTHLMAAPDSKYISSEKCEVKTLDKVFDDLKINSNKCYLKIDTQGFEMPVLIGAENILNNFLAIQVELTFQSLYKNQILFDEIYNYLLNKGYHFVNIEPGFMNEETGELLQIDGVFKKIV